MTGQSLSDKSYQVMGEFVSPDYFVFWQRMTVTLKTGGTAPTPAKYAIRDVPACSRSGPILGIR